MQGTVIFRESLGKFVTELDTVVKQVPQVQREIHERISAEVLVRLRERIGGSGTVQSWQDSYVGSNGGYAAVRPKAKTFYAKQRYDGKAGKPYAVGMITNSIENGHRQSKGQFVSGLGTGCPKGAKLKGKRVVGKGYYQATRAEAEDIARQAAESFLKELAQSLNR